MRRPVLVVPLLAALLSACATSPERPTAPSPFERSGPVRPPTDAPWRKRHFAWYHAADASEPIWQRDPRLQGRFHSEKFPDDLQVVFANRARTDQFQNEIMWVTLFAYDAATDLYLGILLNQPHRLETVRERDNVVVRAHASGAPVAVELDGRYDRAGWPLALPGTFQATVTDGLRAYRRGNFGHNPPAIAECIQLLAPAVARTPPTASAELRHLAHFVLGRCQAEAYETRDAIANFEAAVRLREDDPHSQMGLVAELSVMAFSEDKQQPEGVTFWENRYLGEIARMRQRFPKDPGVELLDIVLRDGKTKAKELNDPRLERIGAGVIRHKAR